MRQRQVMAAAVFGVLLVAGGGVAHAQEHLPGEVGRLWRQTYDYATNSNNNVFRSSRHFHPTQNVFRSSRYYRQRLAASYDGYPLRRVTQVTESINGRVTERVFTQVYPRRHPSGPRPDGYVGYDPLPLAVLPPVLASGELDVVGAPLIEVRAPRPRSRTEIAMRPADMARTPPTERPMMTTSTGPDGRRRTVITSEPIVPADSAPTQVELVASPPADVQNEKAADESPPPSG